MNNTNKTFLGCIFISTLIITTMPVANAGDLSGTVNLTETTGSQFPLSDTQKDIDGNYHTITGLEIIEINYTEKSSEKKRINEYENNSKLNQNNLNDSGFLEEKRVDSQGIINSNPGFQNNAQIIQNPPLIDKMTDNINFAGPKYDTGEIKSSVQTDNFINTGQIKAKKNEADAAKTINGPNGARINKSIQNTYTDNNINSAGMESIKPSHENSYELFNDSNIDINLGGNSVSEYNNNHDVIRVAGIEPSAFIPGGLSANYPDKLQQINNSTGQKNENNTKPRSQPVSSPPPAQSAPSPNTSMSIFPNFFGHGSIFGLFAASETTNILSASGFNWLFFTLLSNIIMLFFGAYLRLRSGNSPGYAYTS